MAWVVVDNSDVYGQAWDSEGLIYEQIDTQRTVSWMRNRCIEIALGLPQCDYIVFWDDDDFYPRTRISTGVKALEDEPDKDIAASSKMFLLLTRENVLMTTGPFHANHGTAATYTVRREYAEKNRFDPQKVRGEELSFTNKWAAKMVQVPAEDTIVVMGHAGNTVDKSDLLARPSTYKAEIINRDNGRRVFQSRWNVPWDLFLSTFVVSKYGTLPVNIL